jgi:2-isopropylmalate synthase
MIFDTIKYFKQNGKTVVYDAEHFFDGYNANSEYAMSTLQTAYEAGADAICLCDTKGASLPSHIAKVTALVCQKVDCAIGIHCHNDNGMAVAGSIAAVEAGAVQVQGTINGFGERCGNANLCTIIPNLQLMMGYQCIPTENMEKLTPIARYVSEVANIIHDERAPFVGNCSFAHKAGMHADAVNKNTSAYEMINPTVVGNQRNILMSEVAGRSAVMSMINMVDSTITKDSSETKKIIERLKELEYEGYQYEGAESSFELVIRKILGKYKPFFELFQSVLRP